MQDQINLPYDPDFDAPNEAPTPVGAKEGEFWQTLSARQSFLIGLLFSILLQGTIGFFIILSILL